MIIIIIIIVIIIIIIIIVIIQTQLRFNTAKKIKLIRMYISSRSCAKSGITVTPDFTSISSFTIPIPQDLHMESFYNAFDQGDEPVKIIGMVKL